MRDQDERAIRYKWDPKTDTGYRLRLEGATEERCSHRRYHVEDWTHHVVANEWDCRSLDEALQILDGLFEIDVTQERDRLQDWLPD